MNTLDFVDQTSLRDDVPDFRAGDTVKVQVKVVEISISTKSIGIHVRQCKAASRCWKVSKCCCASTVVGTRIATCRPSITALNAARMATSVFP